MPENTTLPPRMESVTGQDIDQGKVVTLRKTYPEQLALWQTYLPGDDDTDDYSNTVELYDAVPKYFASKKRMAAMRENGKYLGSLKRHFKHRGRDYQASSGRRALRQRTAARRNTIPRGARSWSRKRSKRSLATSPTGSISTMRPAWSSPCMSSGRNSKSADMRCISMISSPRSEYAEEQE